MTLGIEYPGLGVVGKIGLKIAQHPFTQLLIKQRETGFHATKEITLHPIR